MERSGELRELIRSLMQHPGSGGDGIGWVPARVAAVPVITVQKIPHEPVKIRQLPEMQ